MAYADEERRGWLTRSSLETMFNVIKGPVDTLPLTLYSHIANPEGLARNFTEWLSEKVKTEGAAPRIFASCYLTRPNTFPESFARLRTEDRITMYENILEITSSAGFTRHYFFLDQMEDTIMATPTSRMGEFSQGMRRVLEASVNKATIVVTLHPDSELKLNTSAAQHLQNLAPLDEKHTVDLTTLDRRSEKAVSLAAEYMKHFRQGDPPTPTYPLDPEAIRYLCYLKDGNIRLILQQLHQCLKLGVTDGHPVIDLDYILQHHGETMGSELNLAKYEEFKESSQN